MLTKKQQRIITKAGYDLDRAHQLEHSTEILLNVHAPEKCFGRPCTIHNMSDHSMRGFPQLWRSDRHIMERRNPFGGACPDPDSPWPSGSAEWVHGCIVNPYTNSSGMCQPWQIDGVEAAWIDKKYAVTKDGRVWSFIKTTGPSHSNQTVTDYSSRRELVGRPNQKGYLRVCINYQDRYIHHLVINAWKGARSSDMEVAHLDGDVSNNTLNNLAYVSPSDNNMMKYKHGTMMLGSGHTNSKLTEDQVVRARSMWNDGYTLPEIIKIVNIVASRGSVHNAIIGKTWRHVPGIASKKRVRVSHD